MCVCVCLHMFLCFLVAQVFTSHLMPLLRLGDLQPQGEVTEEQIKALRADPHRADTAGGKDSAASAREGWGTLPRAHVRKT